MPHATTIAIVWCIFGFASSERGNDSALLIQTREFEVQDHKGKVSPAPHNTAIDDEARGNREPTVSLRRFGEFAAKPGLATRLQEDERFWSLYRDYDADADNMRAWRQFQLEMAGRN